MTKLSFYLLLTSVVFLSACQLKAKVVATNLPVDSLQYSAYRWRINQGTQDWELFLAYYIQVAADGNYIVMRHNTTPEPAIYFKGKIDSSVFRLLDSLRFVSMDTVYVSPELRMYDGNTSQLKYLFNKEHCNIDFLQIDAPPFLQRLATTLDTMIFKSSIVIPPFDFSAYEQELKRQSLQRLGGLPKTKRAPLIKMNVDKFKSAPHKRLSKE